MGLSPIGERWGIQYDGRWPRDISGDQLTGSTPRAWASFSNSGTSSTSTSGSRPGACGSSSRTGVASSAASPVPASNRRRRRAPLGDENREPRLPDVDLAAPQPPDQSCILVSAPDATAKRRQARRSRQAHIPAPITETRQSGVGAYCSLLSAVTSGMWSFGYHYGPPLLPQRQERCV